MRLLAGLARVHEITTQFSCATDHRRELARLPGQPVYLANPFTWPARPIYPGPNCLFRNVEDSRSVRNRLTKEKHVLAQAAATVGYLHMS